MNPLIYLGVALSCTVLFVVVDLRDPGFRSSWSTDRRRLRRNAAFLASNLVTMAALNVTSRALEGAVPALVSWPQGPAGATAEIFACLVVAELVNWVSHFVKHRHPWLWRFHLQHHVETRYNVNLTLHTHGLEVVVSGCAMAALLSLCGFSRLAVDVFSLSYYGTNLYKHCHARFSLGVLDWLVVSPAYHRLHHAKGHDGNFGSVLTLFDVVFRTAQFATTPREIDDAFSLPLGVTTPEPFGYVDEMLAPFLPARAITASLPDEASPDRPRPAAAARASLPTATDPEE